MKRLVLLLGIMVLLTMPIATKTYAGPGQASAVTITWLSHAAFQLTSGGKTVLIDPWFTGNDASPVSVEDITKADLILVTHDHFDHVGDTIAIAKNTGATVVAVYETAGKLMAQGLPQENVLYGGFGRNIGGAIDIDGITLVMTAAVHSSQTGAPVGYIITFPGGATVYHAGDTGIFTDMKLYGRLYPIDVALLPIGGGFTMDAMQAAESLRLLRPAAAIPMHFGTFDLLAQDAGQFVAKAKKTAPEVEVIVLEPGQSHVLIPKAGGREQETKYR